MLIRKEPGGSQNIFLLLNLLVIIIIIIEWVVGRKESGESRIRFYLNSHIVKVKSVLIETQLDYIIIIIIRFDFLNETGLLYK